jgi:hypothetical protein
MAVEADRWDLVDEATTRGISILSQGYYEEGYLRVIQRYRAGDYAGTIAVADAMLETTSGDASRFASGDHLRLWSAVYKWRALRALGRQSEAIDLARLICQEPAWAGTQWQDYMAYYLRKEAGR